MRRAGSAWILAALLSLALHGVGAITFVLFFRPLEPSQSSVSEARFRVETFEVPAQTAAARDAGGDRTEDAEPAGARLSGGALPASRARPVRPGTESIRPRAPSSVAVSASPGGAQRIASVPRPEPALAISPTDGARIAPVSESPATAKAAAATAQPVTGVTLVSDRVRWAAADSDRLGARQRPGLIIAAAAKLSDHMTTVAPARGPAMAATDAAGLSSVVSDRASEYQIAALPDRIAALGDRTKSSGAAVGLGSEGQLDPVSIAAVGAFIAPGESAGGRSARDGIGAVLSREPCARLQAEFLPETGHVELRGHIPTEIRRATVLAGLAQFLGTSIPVVDNIKILPEPQCRALTGIERLGLPQSTDQRSDKRLVGEDAHARSYDYRRGQRLILDIVATDYPAYVYVDYFDADGQVTHLVPNERVEPLRLNLGDLVRIGAPDSGGRFLDLVVGPPYGQEIAAAFAASHPVYEDPRPLQEPADPYLSWLRERIAAVRAAEPDFKGEWVYFHVETRDQ